MQRNYALFSKTRYIFLAKMLVAAAKATAAWQAPPEAKHQPEFTSGGLLRTQKGCESQRVSLKND